MQAAAAVVWSHEIAPTALFIYYPKIIILKKANVTYGGSKMKKKRFGVNVGKVKLFPSSSEWQPAILVAPGSHVPTPAALKWSLFYGRVQYK